MTVKNLLREAFEWLDRAFMLDLKPKKMKRKKHG
jgi:hypothetical protein